MFLYSVIYDSYICEQSNCSLMDGWMKTCIYVFECVHILYSTAYYSAQSVDPAAHKHHRWTWRALGEVG